MNPTDVTNQNGQVPVTPPQPVADTQSIVTPIFPQAEPVVTQPIVVEVVPTVSPVITEAPTVNQAPQVAETPVVQVAPPIPPQSSEPVYHTVSGGPETVVDVTRQKMQESLSSPTNQIGQVADNTNPQVQAPPQKSSSGAISFLLLILILGGVGAYLYYFQPDTFQEILTFILGLKDKAFGLIS